MGEWPSLLLSTIHYHVAENYTQILWNYGSMAGLFLNTLIGRKSLIHSSGTERETI
jgi:hypothetical protein